MSVTHVRLLHKIRILPDGISTVLIPVSERSQGKAHMKPSRPIRHPVSIAACLALLLCLSFSSCSAIPGKARHLHPSPAECLPAFPDGDGWYGGDGAYSIRLDDRRVLWLFGDSFVSEQEGRRDRTGMNVVLGTTLAVSTCKDDSGFQIRYHLKKKNGEFVSSFGEKEWLWPQAPFMVRGTLYVPLLSVKADPELPGPFRFRIAGHKFARIRDFRETDPNRWAVEYLDLAPGIPEEIRAFATTAVASRDHVYFYPLYGTTAEGRSILGNILARIPVERIDDPARSIEYLNADGGWTKELKPAKVRIVLDAAVSELSVRYHPGIGKWICIYLSLQNNGDRMLYRTADALEGPWSEPRVLLASVPEVDRHSARYDGNNFCYAGKEHPEFARNGTLVVTYVCNSHEDFENTTSFIRRNLFLYRPVVNTVRISDADEGIQIK